MHGTVIIIMTKDLSQRKWTWTVMHKSLGTQRTSGPLETSNMKLAVAVAAAVAVAGRGFGPLGIEVEKQGFRTAWLLKVKSFLEKISNRVLPY